MFPTRRIGRGGSFGKHAIDVKATLLAAANNFSYSFLKRSDERTHFSR